MGETDSLVFAFSVKHEQKMDCGGAYAKLLPPTTDVENFNGDAKYSIMFGPDICGYSTKKVQAIFNFGGENLAKEKDVKTPDNEYTHQFLLIVNKDSTYEIRVDGEEKGKGDMKEDWNFELPKTIKDPEQSKPEDWVDDEEIDDPEAVKPEGWGDEPEMIADPDSTKPDDWDDEEDGEWQAPMIDNPDYVEAVDVWKRGPIGFIGVEVWQVKSGTVFSDFILTDSVEEAEAFMEERKTNEDEEKEAKTAWEDAKKETEDEDKEDDDDVDADDEEEGKDEL